MLLGPNNRPPLWNVSPALVHPKFRPFWRKALLAVMVTPGGQLVEFDFAGRKLGTMTGAPTKVTVPSLGAAIDFPGGGSQRLAFSGKPAALRKLTAAALIMRDGNVAFASFLATDEGSFNNGYSIGDSGGTSSSFGIVKAGVTAITSGLTISTGVPYFAATSHDEQTGATNFVLRRLDTGALSIATATNTQASSSGDGTFIVGNTRPATLGTLGWNGKVAMGFIADDFQPMAELVRWSEDPWGPFRPWDFSDAKVVYAKPAAGGGGATMIPLHLFFQEAA